MPASPSTAAAVPASAWVTATARSGAPAKGSTLGTRSNGASPAVQGLGAPRREGALHLQPAATGGRGFQVILPPTLRREPAEPTRLRDARPKFQSKSEQHIIVTSVHYSPFFEENKHERQNPLYEARDCFDDDI